MKSPDIQAPALARGLAVLECLQRRPMTLDRLTRELELPKASLLRLCRTLEAMGLVGRNDAKAYVAKVHLVPAETADLTAHVERTLQQLAADTNQTAEWYVYEDRGMVLLRRADPPRGEVAVHARNGWSQGWTGELDAVVALGLAFFKPDPIDYRSSWTYIAPGKQGNLPVAQARRIVKQAGDTALTHDPTVNNNGVRRTAVLLARQGRPVGVLAIAEYAGLGTALQSPDITAALTRAAEQLTGESFPPANTNHRATGPQRL